MRVRAGVLLGFRGGEAGGNAYYLIGAPLPPRVFRGKWGRMDCEVRLCLGHLAEAGKQIGARMGVRVSR